MKITLDIPDGIIAGFFNGVEVTAHGMHWKHEWVCHRCGRKRPIPLPPMFTVFMCRKCEHLLYVEEDEDFPQKLGKIAAKSCPCCGEQEEGLWRLLGRAEGFEGTVFTEESDED